MASNPCEAGGYGPDLDSKKTPIETPIENRPGTNEIEGSAKDGTRDPNQDGDGDREKEEEFSHGDSWEKGDSVVEGENGRKDDSSLAVETDGIKETDRGLGPIACQTEPPSSLRQEKEEILKSELEEDQNVKVEEQELEKGEKTDVMENDQRACYYFPLQDDKNGVSVDDLVWGKVKSHPWWPGQIFDPKYGSKMALKLQKKDHFLVAYFGDKTFAWVSASQLKPFQAHFSAMEKQSSMEPFLNAVNATLEEVSRRVELGMACHCLADETYASLKHRKVENAGICKGTCSAAVDRSVFVNAFQPMSLLEYVQALALCPCGGFDRLELTIATAHLKAFYRSKGHSELPVFVSGPGLVENDAEITLSMSEVSGKGKTRSSSLVASSIKLGKKTRNRSPKNNEQEGLSKQKEEEDVYRLASSTPVASNIKSGKRPRGRPRKNHISEDGSEQMEEGVDYPARSSGKKCKVVDSESTELARSKKERLGKEVDSVTDAPSSTHALSLKIGDLVSQVASRLKESPRILKSNDGKLKNYGAKRNHKKGADCTSKDVKKNEGAAEDYSSPSEMLSQLYLVAREPIKAYSFLSMIISFFTEFRDSLSSGYFEDQELVKSMVRKRGRKKKVVKPASSEMLEPDYMQDSYWSDIILQSSPEREPLSRGQKRKGGFQKKGQKKKTKSAGEPWLSVSRDPSPDTEDSQLVGSSSPNAKQEVKRESIIRNIEEKIKEETPTALILSFNESDALPPTVELIKIFSPYGPLREEETEVLRKTNRAKVVFKYRDDADKAFSSAGKYSVFGPALVSYRLKPSSKSSPATSKDTNDASPTKDELQAQEGTEVAIGNT